jgi:hypothetical protein
MGQGQGARIFPPADVTGLRSPSQREAPEPWTRWVRTVPLPSHTPNEGLEPTASSVRCAPASGSGSRPALGRPEQRARLNDLAAQL